MPLDDASGQIEPGRPAFNSTNIYMTNPFQERYIGTLEWTLLERVWCGIGAVPEAARLQESVISWALEE